MLSIDAGVGRGSAGDDEARGQLRPRSREQSRIGTPLQLNCRTRPAFRQGVSGTAETGLSSRARFQPLVVFTYSSATTATFERCSATESGPPRFAFTAKPAFGPMAIQRSAGIEPGRAVLPGLRRW